MTTRTPIPFAALLALMLSSATAHAHDYAMASVSVPASADVAAPPESTRAESTGGDSSSRYMLGVDAAPAHRANPVRAVDGDTDDNANAGSTGAANVANRVGAPASAAPANRPRSGNRWQSLVPGAIK